MHIIHPLTYSKLSIFEKDGKHLLKHYVKLIQSAGAEAGAGAQQPVEAGAATDRDNSMVKVEECIVCGEEEEEGVEDGIFVFKCLNCDDMAICKECIVSSMGVFMSENHNPEDVNGLNCSSCHNLFGYADKLCVILKDTHPEKAKQFLDFMEKRIKENLEKVREQKQREREEKLRLAQMKKDERINEISRKKFLKIGDIVNPKCPNCNTVFYDFLACYRVECASCGYHFCAWCLRFSNHDPYAVYDHIDNNRCGFSNGQRFGQSGQWNQVKKRYACEQIYRYLDNLRYKEDVYKQVLYLLIKHTDENRHEYEDIIRDCFIHYKQSVPRRLLRELERKYFNDSRAAGGGMQRLGEEICTCDPAAAGCSCGRGGGGGGGKDVYPASPIDPEILRQIEEMDRQEAAARAGGGGGGGGGGAGADDDPRAGAAAGQLIRIVISGEIENMIRTGMPKLNDSTVFKTLLLMLLKITIACVKNIPIILITDNLVQININTLDRKKETLTSVMRLLVSILSFEKPVFEILLKNNIVISPLTAKILNEYIQKYKETGGNVLNIKLSENVLQHGKSIQDQLKPVLEYILTFFLNKDPLLFITPDRTQIQFGGMQKFTILNIVIRILLQTYEDVLF